MLLLRGSLPVPLVELDERQRGKLRMKLYKPFRFWTTYKGHAGIDYGVPTGTPVRSSQAGRITQSREFNERSGFMRELDHGNGVRERAYHLRNLSGPEVGKMVEAGDVWATSGNSGTVTSGPHVHHEIWVNGVLMSGDNYWRYVDDQHYVGEGTTSGGGAIPLEDVMNAEQEKKLDVVLSRAGWVKDRLAGSVSGASVTDLIRESISISKANSAAIRALADAKGIDAQPILDAIEDVAARPVVVEFSDEQVDAFADAVANRQDGMDIDAVKTAVREVFAEAF